MSFKHGDLLISRLTGRIIKYEGYSTGVVVDESSIKSSGNKMGVGYRSEMWDIPSFDLYIKEGVGFEF
ncbi:MAG: hypothetical protein RR744_00280 [Cellulosilyticaceae bacterium]